MNDLKLIDELLCDYKTAKGITLADLEHYSSVTAAAMQRLRQAWKSGEMPVITLSFANHFDSTRETGND
jgi:hypothetical protein